MSRDNVIDDLPASFLNDEDATLVIDPNSNFYRPDSRHDGIVRIEKCLVRKGHYKEIEIEPASGNLVTSSSHNLSFLVKETNFQDIGGGLLTFDRHYATYPTPWFEYEEVSYRADYDGTINYRNKAGIGASWHATRNTLAKVNYYYINKKFLPTTSVPDTSTSGTTYADDFTRFFNTAPQSRLGYDWESYNTPSSPPLKVVIAPDTITKYLGGIYEFKRYTMEL